VIRLKPGSRKGPLKHLPTIPGHVFLDQWYFHNRTLTEISSGKQALTILACIGISAGVLNESNRFFRHIDWNGRLMFKTRLYPFSAYGGTLKNLFVTKTTNDSLGIKKTQ
jgi:hypothetical protein